MMDAAVWRILDANANRAREALRVMEEYARFALDDPALTAQAKDLRHDLADALKPVETTPAVTMRDTRGDVGAGLAGSGEYRRATSIDVVRAAGKRLSEGLRALEEYGKVVDVEMARRVEGIRYRAYDLEKRLLHTVAARARFANVRVYVLVTEALCARPWQEVMRAAAEGGADCFQLREPELDSRQLFERATEFRALCAELNVLCMINDRADIALAANADGVHLGQRDLPVQAARRVVGPQRIVGVSTHNLAEAEAAIAACPDYLAAGPMFATAVKPEYGIAGPEYLRELKTRTSLPLVAIGGISENNVGAVAQAGASAVAVCRSVIESGDPRAAVMAIRMHAAENKLQD